VKILLDECVDRRLAGDFIGHEVKTVEQMGWKSKKNGELLALAAKDFEILVTTDRNLSFQQDVRSSGIAVIVMSARTNRLTDLRPIIPALLKVLPFLKKGEVREIGV
jgi:predicted nuclease of predicted toxin-antitoxin system